MSFGSSAHRPRHSSEHHTHCMPVLLKTRSFIGMGTCTSLSSSSSSGVPSNRSEGLGQAWLVPGLDTSDMGKAVGCFHWMSGLLEGRVKIRLRRATMTTEAIFLSINLLVGIRRGRSVRQVRHQGRAYTCTTLSSTAILRSKQLQPCYAGLRRSLHQICTTVYRGSDCINEVGRLG